MLSKLRNTVIFIFFLAGTTAYGQSFLDISAFANTPDMPDEFGSGIAIADYDNDGDLDFFAGTEFGLRSRLYRNDGNNLFTDVSNQLGLTIDYRVRASLFLDYDGDTDLDLILLGDCFGIDSISCPERITVFTYEQLNDGTFSLQTNTGIDFGNRYNISNVNEATVVGGISAGDINNDGWLDIVITVWGKRFFGAQMSLFLNDGDGTFTDISNSSGTGLSFASRYQSIIHDFNRDGLMDISVNIDFTENEFWLNNGDNTFQNIASSLQVDSGFNEMGMTIGDYDNDGDFDYYSTNISRVEDGTLRHNVFFRNDWNTNNTLSFTEISNDINIGVGNSGWDWGTTFFDSNNNGYLDLAVTNGWTNTVWMPDQSRLWQNIDGQLFTDISAASNFNDILEASTLLAADMDRDGDLDLLQTIKGDTSGSSFIKLYQNNTSSNPNSGNYLVIKPRMTGANHFAIGAVVKITYDNGTKFGMRLITAGTSFYGQEPAEAFFGLADNTLVDEVTIEWPDNTVTKINNIAVNQVITVDNSLVLSDSSDKQFEINIIPNPVDKIFNIYSTILLSRISIYNILGQKVYNVNKNLNAINISSLPSGTYFVKMFALNNNELQTVRIIKN